MFFQKTPEENQFRSQEIRGKCYNSPTRLKAK